MSRSTARLREEGDRRPRLPRRAHRHSRVIRLAPLWLVGVVAGCCGVAAAVRESPGQGAGGGLAELPAGCLFGAVVATAQRRKIALARPAALVIGDRMIVVAAGRLPPAARKRTGPVPELDQVPQHPGGRYPGVSRAWVQGPVPSEPADPDPRQPVARSAGPADRPRPAGRPGAGAGAAMPDGPPLGAGHVTHQRLLAARRAARQITAGPGVQRAQARGFTGLVRPAQPRGQRHRQVHRAAQPGRPGPAGPGSPPSPAAHRPTSTGPAGPGAQPEPEPQRGPGPGRGRGDAPGAGPGSRVSGPRPASSAMNTLARNRSKVPWAPCSFSQRAAHLPADQQRSSRPAAGPGRPAHQSPRSPVHASTRASFSAFCRRRIPASGSTASTARRHAARNCPVVCPGAAGSTRSSTASRRLIQRGRSHPRSPPPAARQSGPRPAQQQPRAAAPAPPPGPSPATPPGRSASAPPRSPHQDARHPSGHQRPGGPPGH